MARHACAWGGRDDACGEVGQGILGRNGDSAPETMRPAVTRPDFASARRKHALGNASHLR